MKTLVALVATIVASFAFATPAEAATSACVSNHEYHTVKNEPGLRKAAVHRIFDTRGTRVNFFEYKMRGYPTSQTETRQYRACEGRFVYVEYQHIKGTPWRVTTAYKGGAVIY